MVAEMKIPSMSSADIADDSAESVKEPLESTEIMDTSSVVSVKEPKRQKKKRTVRINDQITRISEKPLVDPQKNNADIVKVEQRGGKSKLRNGIATENKVLHSKVTVICNKSLHESRPVKAQKVEQTPPESPPSPPPLGNWPLKRSQSVDSRDNPFLPGGDLSQEAEDLLKRATIIRDRFILNESNEQIQKCQGDSDSPSKHSPQDGLSDQPVEETISPEVAQSAETTPLTNEKPKENGRFEDSATPESIKLDMSHDQTDGTAITDDTNKDKKKQKKCCVVM